MCYRINENLTNHEKIDQMFEVLESKNLTKYKLQNQLLSSDFCKILEKLEACRDTFERMKNVFSNPMLSESLYSPVEKLGLTREDFNRIFSHFLIQTTLDFMELFKKFLIENLKHDVEIGGNIISDKTTFGTLVWSISKETNVPELKDIFPYKFRNLLGHGAWWWDDRKISFRDDEGKLDSIDYKEFFATLENFDNVFRYCISQVNSRLGF